MGNTSMLASSTWSPAKQASAIELNARASADFDAKVQESTELLQVALQSHGAGCITQASSLGAEDMVVSHLINTLQLDIGIFVLETGALHAETLALLDQLKADSRAPVSVYHPVQESVLQFVAREGNEAMYKSIELRKACCGVRKMEPLGRMLAGRTAWVTGLRREQSNARGEVPFVEPETRADGSRREKLNPLADWSWADVWTYVQRHQVPYNPLHDQFMPSIGCAPCTRAIAVGEDFRSGRWWWEQDGAKECGLHVKADDEADDSQAAGEVSMLPPAGAVSPIGGRP